MSTFRLPVHSSVHQFNYSLEKCINKQIIPFKKCNQPSNIPLKKCNELDYIPLKKCNLIYIMYIGSAFYV